MVDTIYGSKERTKVLLFHEKAFANRTIRLSNRTKVTDYITACGKIARADTKNPRDSMGRGDGERERTSVYSFRQSLSNRKSNTPIRKTPSSL